MTTTPTRGSSDIDAARRRGRTTRSIAAAEREAAAAERARQRRRAAVSGEKKPPRRRARILSAGVGHRGRSWVALSLIVTMFVAAGYQLIKIQAVQADEYSAKAASQGSVTVTLPALRGTIYDRHGTPLAFTVQGRALAAWPALFTSDEERRVVADIVGREVADADADEIFTKLTTSSSYVYLARGLLPAQADAIEAEILDAINPADRSPVTTERQDLRRYPQGDVLQSILGTTNWDGHGAGGVEVKYDDLLSGTDGERTVDVDSKGRPIPGTERGVSAAVDGGDVYLTIDADLQYAVSEILQDWVHNTGSEGGMVVVRDVTSPDVLAMVSYYDGKTAAEIGNMAVTSPFEPGSVVKPIVFGAALERGILKPDTHYSVTESIVMGGHVINDAWPHSRVGMTATGILGKSSNVGTLMVAQEVGQDAFAAELQKYGLGEPTGIGLPADSAGLVPAQSQWSATSFANLPLGQGLSMTMVQMSDMYQGIANEGYRIPPSVVAATSINGEVTPMEARPGFQQLSPESSRTLVEMMRGTVQDGDMMHGGTAPAAALTGYQVAGKTGTAQKVDPECGCYSKTEVTATFAGIVPADSPQYVITVMLDAPADGAEAGGVAAPLFRDIAAYTLRAFDVPPSPEPAPIYDLYTNMGE